MDGTIQAAVARNVSTRPLRDVSVMWMDPRGGTYPLETRMLGTIGPGSEGAFARPRSLWQWPTMDIQVSYRRQDDTVWLADRRGDSSLLG